MNIQISSSLQLTEIRKTDRDSLVHFLNDRQIYNNTLNIPFPYTENDAESWIDLTIAYRKKFGFDAHRAIRKGNKLIGALGLIGYGGRHLHRAEVGYWLARPFWNQGIMTRVLSRFAEYAFDDLDLTKLTANVFESNQASARVLIKCGFQQEGRFVYHYLKDGRPITALVFGRIRPGAHLESRKQETESDS